MKGLGATLIAGVITIAILFILVRPGSKGPTLVTSVSRGLQGLIGKATGGGQWNKG